MIIRRTRSVKAFVLGLSTVLAADALFAADGVVEINDTRAQAGGVTPGDTPGYPVTLTESGSYRLTGDLSPPSSSTGVQISASNLSLDLGGHSILGPVTCFGGGSSINCVPSATGNGIDVFPTAERNLIIRDGIVSGMGSFGINLNGSVNVIVEDVTISNSRLSAVLAGSSTILRRVMVQRNGAIGIALASGIVSDGQVIANGLDGINASDHVLVRDNVSNENGSEGVLVAEGSLLLRNMLYHNEGFGISASNGPSGYGQNLIMRTGLPGSDTVGGTAVELGDNYCGGGSPGDICP